MENYDLWDEEKQKSLKRERFNRKYRKEPKNPDEYEYEQMMDELL